MPDEFVYRTQKPEVLALEAEWRKDFDAQHRAIKAFKRKWPIKREGERKLRPLVSTTSFASERVLGYQMYGGEPPEGWKLDRKRGILEPKRTHPIGKQIAADLDKCRLRNCRDDLAEHGIVTSQWVGLSLQSPGVEFIDGWCYVIFTKALDPTRQGRPGYDPKVWEPVKLSVYYAAKEASDA